MSVKSFRLFFWRFSALAALSVSAMKHANGVSAILHPSADASLFETFSDNNSGANGNLIAGSNASNLRGRALMRFDAAGAIPPGAIIQSVTLTVEVVIVPPGGGAASVFDLRRSLADWGEGRGTGNGGSTAVADEVTWNARFHPTQSWSAPGGTISNDFASIASASLLLPDLGNYTFNSTTGLVSDVQCWLQNPGSNFGWVLMSQSEETAFTARRIGSRESTNAPSLLVQFSVPESVTIQGPTKTGGKIQFSFLASPGPIYTAEYRDLLEIGSWLPLTNIGPLSTSSNVFVLDPFPTNAQRYYRVRTH